MKSAYFAKSLTIEWIKINQTLPRDTIETKLIARCGLVHNKEYVQYLYFDEDESESCSKRIRKTKLLAFSCGLVDYKEAILRIPRALDGKVTYHFELAGYSLVLFIPSSVKSYAQELLRNESVTLMHSDDCVLSN